MSLPQGEVTGYRFGAFELDVVRRQLRREGEIVPIAPKPLELLALLVQHADRMVGRAEALAEVWAGVSVSDATLASTLRDLRRALSDDAKAPLFVQTARGFGFRFVAPVQRLEPQAGSAAAPGHARLVGRQALLEQLEDALAAAARGRGRLVLLEGEPGIGKTSALAALAEAARAVDATVCQARFPEAGAGSAYRPWEQLLAELVGSRPPERLAEELGAAARPWLARLVPGLVAGPAPQPEPDDESTTLRLFGAVTGFLRRVSRNTPLVLVLDDLQGADRSSLRLLESLADEIHQTRILIAGAYRSCDFDPEHPLPAALAELARGPGYVCHRLAGVDLEATRALLRGVTGSEPDAEQLAQIQQRTDGNPFYVLELARDLAEQAERGGRARVPPSLCELLRGRLQRLPPRCRDALEFASVVGREFEVELVRRASGLPLSEVTDALEHGRRAGLIEAGWGEAPRFRHALVQEAIYAGLPPARLRLLHRRVGEACQQPAADDRGGRFAARAHHLCRVVEDVGQAAIEAALAAAAHAEANLAFEEAARLYRLALDALARLGDESRTRQLEILLGLARSHLRAGELGKAADAARRAAALARSLHRPDLVTEAALLFSDYVLLDSSEPHALLVEALPQLGPQHEALRGRGLAALSVALWYDGPSARRLALADEALAIARQAGDRSDIVSALIAKRHALTAPEHLPDRLRLCDQALGGVAGRHDAQRCLVLSWRACDLMEAGDRLAAERDVGELARSMGATPLRRFLDFLPRWRAMIATMEGRFGDADQAIAEGILLRKRAEFQNAESYGAIQAGLLMRERGLQAPLQGVLGAAPWVAPYRARVPAAHAAISLIELEAGRPAEAQRLLGAIAADDYAALCEDPELLVTASWLAEICARLGAREVAGALHDRLAAWRDRVATLYAIACRGSMARYLGLLAATAGRPDQAADCFEAALEGNRALGAELYEAWSQWEYAQLLGARGGCARAGALAEQARASAGRLGLRKLAAEIDRAAPLL